MARESSSDWAATRGPAPLLAAVALVLVVLAAYANSFFGPYVFDDVPAIRDNASIRNWSDFGRVLSPPEKTTVSGRPVVNASFALSYALSPDGTWGHHGVNFLIHTGSALLLFGLMRRTLLRPALRGQFGADAGLLALVAALLWAVHPVSTESVTYLVQRAESLMGLFYLLTLYAFARAVDSAYPARWHVAAFVGCALGMATKEVMVSAPLFVLLYDRTFVAGSFGEAWRRRGRWHVAMAATWLVLAWLVLLAGGNRGGSIGFGVGIGWWDHAATQFGAVLHYLRLTFWPHPLVFEYEPEWVNGFSDYALPALAVAVLLALTLASFRRNRAAGFVGLWCCAILAPTSLLPAPTQLIVEHRMYLPLAALIAWFVATAYAWLGRRGLAAFLIIAVAFAFLTHRRNTDYRSELALWTDTVAKRPRNPLAQGSLGNALSRAGRFDEALTHCAEAVRLDPKNAVLSYDLGVVLAKLGRGAEAIAAYRQAVQLDPNYAEARNNLAVALARAGRREEAVSEFAAALRLRPGDPEAHFNFGALLAELGRVPEAGEHFAAALRLKPDFAAARVEWGTALVRDGRFDEALEQYRQATRIQPSDTRARNKIGLLLLALGRGPEAVAELEEALRLQPGDPETQANLALARKRLGVAPPR